VTTVAVPYAEKLFKLLSGSVDMGWGEILSSPAIGNLFLLVASLVGVGGSYTIYRLRLRNRKSAIRGSIKSELDTMTTLSKWAENPQGVPQQTVLPTAAYESHLDEIGLLTNEETEEITSFYSQALILDDVIKWNREIRLNADLESSAVDKGRKNREAVIADRLDKLAVDRWRLVNILKRELGEDYKNPDQMKFPEEAGDTVRRDHPVVRSNGQKLLFEGYLETVDHNTDLLKLTQDGENWLNKSVDDNIGY